MYSRKIDGRVLTLSASGWAYDRLFVLYDYETESLWYHLPDSNALTCVAGPYVGSELPELVSASRPWNRWRASHPTTKILKSDLLRRR